MDKSIGRFPVFVLVLSVIFLLAGCRQEGEGAPLARADGCQLAVIPLSLPVQAAPADSADPPEQAPERQAEEIPAQPLPQAPAPSESAPTQTAPTQAAPIETEPTQAAAPVAAEPEPASFPPDGSRDFVVNTETEQLEVAATALYSQAQLVFESTNRERRAAGLTELVYDSRLQQAADLRAVEASVLWSHTRPDGSSCFTAAEGISGENLASGYADAAAVVAGWMQSEGHRENLLLASYTRIAVAGVRVGETVYWVQLFGK